MNPGDQREPGIFEPRYHLPKIINCAGLNKRTICRIFDRTRTTHDALLGSSLLQLIAEFAAHYLVRCGSGK